MRRLSDVEIEKSNASLDETAINYILDMLNDKPSNATHEKNELLQIKDRSFDHINSAIINEGSKNRHNNLIKAKNYPVSENTHLSGKQEQEEYLDVDPLDINGNFNEIAIPEEFLELLLA